jgi:hypothetical protein
LFLSPFLHFLITFFFPTTLEPHHKQTTLYTTTLSNERRVTLSLSLTILSYSCPTFTFCIIAPFYLSRSTGIATDIGFLAAGLDGHVVGSGIGRNYENHWEYLATLFGGTHFSFVDFVATALSKNTAAKPFGAIDQLFRSSLH